MQYKSKRDQAWRNLMVATINAGIDQGVFSLDPEEALPYSQFYSFDLEGTRSLAAVNDIGSGELSIHVAYDPTAFAVESIHAELLCNETRRRMGRAYGSGWVERKDGAWLQTHPGRRRFGGVAIKRGLEARLATIKVEPRGYKDHGRRYF